jgi:hypothetical protein
MNYHALFEKLISEVLSGELTRKDASAMVASKIGVDAISGGNESLLVNCEWALRHLNEPGYYTGDSELFYLQSCLRGEIMFSVPGRDAAISGLA